MPYKANEARRHKIPKARYRLANWPEYDRALQQRGSLTVWVTPEALAAWQPPPTGQRGRPRDYSDLAIETGYLLRLAFDRPWRQTEGLLRSVTVLLGIDVDVPDCTTFSRRSPGLVLAASLAHAQARGPVHVVLDATGLKAYGAALRVVTASVNSLAVQLRSRKATRCGDIPCRWPRAISRRPRRSVSSATKAQNVSYGLGQPGSAASTVQPRSVSNTRTASPTTRRTSGSTSVAPPAGMTALLGV